MDIISPGKKLASFQKPANDDEPHTGGMPVIVAIPSDLPITQIEIEVFASLLNHWDGVAANDNWKEPK